MVCTVGIRGVDYSNDKASVEGLLEVAANKSLLWSEENSPTSVSKKQFGIFFFSTGGKKASSWLNPGREEIRQDTGINFLEL